VVAEAVAETEQEAKVVVEAALAEEAGEVVD